MDDETWIIGNELVEQGFADTVIGENNAKASFDLGMYANAPDKIKGSNQKHPIDNERDLEQLLTQDAGFSRSQAKAMIKNGFKSLNSMQDAGNDDEIQSINNLIKQIGA